MIKNAVMIVLDSLQFNYLGCYGNDWIKTPNIDRLATEGVLFENAYTEGSPTIPTRRAMLTGRYTLPFKGWGPLDSDDTTVADIAMANQCRSALYFDTAPMHMYKYGYQRGFDEVVFLRGQELDLQFYNNDPIIHVNPEDYIKIVEKKDETEQDKIERLVNATELTGFLRHRQYWRTDEDQMVAQLTKCAMQYFDRYDPNKPFLFWFDSFDPHEPWDPPSVYDPDMKCPYNTDYKGKDIILPTMGSTTEEKLYTEEELHHIRMLYAEKVTCVDKWVGKLLDHLKSKGLYENTMIIVTSDHGEPLGNGKHGHGIMRKCRPWPYEELVHLPLIIRTPGIEAGKRIKSFVADVDLASTMLDFLGIKDEKRMADIQGQSLLPLMRGEVDKVRDWAIAGYHGFSWSLITEDWSYVHWLHQDKMELDGGDSMKRGDIMYEFYDVQSAIGGASDAVIVEDRNRLRAKEQDKEIWTCTPSATTETPQGDELYKRKEDPWQLENVLDKHPEKGVEMLKKLREIMLELRTG
ncbi:MAG: sulfatase [Deltaproteobacteria bacterium]|nr:sulfatase [Deltaproteobacteria bacterium]MBW2086543.1 sulfatase [Deltaproteobacteria bacterium]